MPQHIDEETELRSIQKFNQATYKQLTDDFGHTTSPVQTVPILGMRCSMSSLLSIDNPLSALQVMKYFLIPNIRDSHLVLPSLQMSKQRLLGVMPFGLAIP